MDLKFILDEIEKADPEVYEKLSPRRHILKSFGSKVAVAALPFALGSLFKKAYGKTTDAVIDALNYALTLEYLEYNFYYQGTAAVGLIPIADQAAFQTILAHELEHVNFLSTAISNAGATPYKPNGYTGTANTSAGYNFVGNFPTIFTDYTTFLTVSQTFEDTGVRAYKGQAGTLQGSAYLTAALQIHSVEARHASHVRQIRRKLGVSDNPKPWITGNIAPASSVAANYAGEDNTTQLTVNIASLPAVSGTTSTVVATEAFDEPLTMSIVQGLVGPFLT